MENSYSLLYVDDEPDNLSVFNARFRKSFKIFTASSASEGFDLLGKHDIQMVISDQRMPEITGVQFLEKIKDKHPDVVRMILTAYTESEDIINAINRGGIYQYVKKPWIRDELKVLIDEGFNYYSSRRKNKDLVSRLYATVNELESSYYLASHDIRDGSSPNYLKLLEDSIIKIEGTLRKVAIVSEAAAAATESRINFDTIVKSVLHQLENEKQTRLGDVKISIQPDINYSASPTVLFTMLESLVGYRLHFFDTGISNKFFSIDLRSDDQNVIIVITDSGTGTEGNAVGLHIVKRACELLNGTITIVSKENIGTWTTVELPLSVKKISDGT